MRVLKNFFLIFIFLLLTTKVNAAVTISTLAVDNSAPTIEQSFNVNADISGASENTIYFVKCRIGVDSSNLKDGQTYNSASSVWLNDTDAWTSMPVVTIGSDGSWQGVIQCRVKNGSVSGSKLVYTRACLNNNGACGTSFQSADYQTINVVLPTETPVPTPTPIPTEVPTPISTPTESIAPSITSTITETPQSTPTPTLTITPAITFYSNILISEIMVNPETGNNEWVEIYNNNDFSVNLNNWYIDDAENSGSSPKKFSIIIDAKNYEVINLTSAIFNNDGDIIRLLDNNKILQDSFEYDYSERGKTWGRINFNNDDYCIQEPSKGVVNNNYLDVDTSDTNSPTNTTIKSTSTTAPSKTPKPLKGVTYSIPQKSSNIISTSNINNSRPPQTGKILGMTTNRFNNINIDFLLLKSLSFMSFAFSLLTILSILLKMKFINV